MGPRPSASNGNPDDRASPTVEARTVRKLLEAIYQGRTPPQFHEYAPLKPMSVYGDSKAWGETQTAWADQHDVPFEETIERAREILKAHIRRHRAFEITCLGGLLICSR